MWLPTSSDSGSRAFGKVFVSRRARSLALLEQERSQFSLFLHYHLQRFPLEYPNKKGLGNIFSILGRLVENKRYDLEKEPREKIDVAKEHHDVVMKMKKAYDAWWKTRHGERERKFEDGEAVC